MEEEMQSKNPFFSDFSKLVTGAFGIAQNARSEMENAVSSIIERWLSERDFVNREEFDAVRIIAKKNAEQNAELLKTISDLELKVKKLDPGSPKKFKTRKD